MRRPQDRSLVAPQPRATCLYSNTAGTNRPSFNVGTRTRGNGHFTDFIDNIVRAATAPALRSANHVPIRTILGQDATKNMFRADVIGSARSSQARRR